MSIRKRSTRIFLYSSLFLVLFVGFTAVFIIIENNTEQNELHRQDVIESEQQNILSLRQYLSHEFATFRGDLFFLKDIFITNTKEDTIDIWLPFVAQHPRYMQLRYIDKNGDEVIRIDQDEMGVVRVVPDDELQNKNRRYYFQEAKLLQEGDFYYSALDLNIEQGVIEEPYVPTIRIITPIYQEGVFAGVIVINCHLSDIFDSIDEQFMSHECGVYIINRYGYYIYNRDDPSKTFTFMSPNLSHIKIQNDYLDVWQDLYENQDNDLHTLITENGVFNYTYLIQVDQDLIKSHDTNYIIITRLMPDSEDGSMFYKTFADYAIDTIKENSYIITILLLLSILLAVLLGKNQINRIEITRQARIDAFTGTYNRAFGLSMLERMDLELKRRRQISSICFIDIDSLKYVNDNFGHKLGDYLIKNSVEVIKKHISTDDFLIRLGGDEFLIVFADMNEQQAEAHWQTICKEVNQISLGKDIDFNVWLSHGISEFGYQNGDVMDVISRADKRMYQEKYDRKMKNMQFLSKNDKN